MNGKQQGKKQKKQAVIPQRDNYSRLSFLHQSSRLLVSTGVAPELGRAYAGTLKTIAKKNVLRLSPHIKRSICRACQVPLLAGITSKTRLVNNSKLQTPHNDILVVECMVCQKKKRYPVGKETGSELWVDKAKRNN